MPNIEEAIEKQEEIISYFRVITSPTDFEQKARDVLAVLKEQEAVEFAREFMSDAVHETAKEFRQTIVRCKDCIHFNADNIPEE